MIRLVLPAALCVAGCATVPEKAADYRAIGTEPFWGLTIAGLRTILDYDTGEKRLDVATPPVRTTFNGHRYQGRQLTIDVVHTPCSDGMSDRRYPDKVSVFIAAENRTLNGCGGTPTGAQP